MGSQTEKELFDKKINDAIQAALQSQLVVSTSLLGANTPNWKLQPNSTLKRRNWTEDPNFRSGNQNSRQDSSLEADSYIIQNENGDATATDEVRHMRDAQALQHITATVNSEIRTSLLRIETTYAAYRKLAITYGAD